MTTAIRDAETLRNLTPVALATYLRLRGWQPTGQWRQHLATVWELESAPETALLAPNTQEAADYPERMADLLATLAEVERRSKEAVYDDIIRATTPEDLLRLRALHPLAEGGAIPIKDAPKLHEGAYRMMEAAASVVQQKRPYLAGRKPASVSLYLEQTHVSAESGSYVIVVHSPIDVTNEAPMHETHETTVDVNETARFGRQVLTTLAKALGSLQEISTQLDAETAGESEVEARLDAFITHGGTAELCEAIAQLHESVREQNIEVVFSWSKLLPTPSVANLFTIDQSLQPTTRRLQRSLRRRQAHEEMTLSGRIIGLRDSAERDNHVATVTFIAKVNGKQRHVRIVLRNEAERSLCPEAMRARARIVCSGRFVQIATYNILEDHHDLEIEPAR